VSHKAVHSDHVQNNDLPMSLEKIKTLTLGYGLELIPFGPDDDAPIGEALKARWKAKVAAKKAARLVGQALDHTGGTSNGEDYVVEAPYGDFAGAISEVDREIESKPYDAELLFRRGNLHMGLGEYDLAFQDYVNALLVQAMVRFKQSQYERTINACNFVLELVPDYMVKLLPALIERLEIHIDIPS
jgi:tetratricopeptide (TPR) repeat protein